MGGITALATVCTFSSLGNHEASVAGVSNPIALCNSWVCIRKNKTGGDGCGKMQTPLVGRVRMFKRALCPTAASAARVDCASLAVTAKQLGMSEQPHRQAPSPTSGEERREGNDYLPT